ncbi:MAG: preprotein translocase subunit SecG [Blastocatellia bacterium]|nr:preprotein translocase subunit SecG [Blastocatellia bacterium]
MPWYGYILYFFFILSCLILVGVVLLQPGKGDAAAAFGGGTQTAFGPRGAQKPLERVTLIAASLFMILAFVFSIPGITSPRPASLGIEDKPLNAPAVPPPATPAPTPAPATTPAPAGDAAKPADAKKADEKKADEKKADDKKATEADTKKDGKDTKDAKKPVENKDSVKKAKQ